MLRIGSGGGGEGGIDKKCMKRRGATSLKKGKGEVPSKTEEILQVWKV